MNDSVMKKLNYENQPDIGDYKSRACREYLRAVSHYSCAYCTISESEAPGATFHIEHFRPQARFPHLTNKCNNLRYACPRCNLIKGSYWISREDGCIRDCEKCNTKICHENIYRLIDCLIEDPNEYMALKEDDTLEAKNGSKPAVHTIKYLRLNRVQLIKLRRTRRFIDLWKQELEKGKEAAIKKIAYIQSEQNRFEELIKLNPHICNDENSQLCDIIITLLKMLSEETTYSLALIDTELEKVERLLEMREEPDNAI